ncbi:hypothetical protein GCM10020331_035360 [Ectobacillus funiculus]
MSILEMVEQHGQVALPERYANMSVEEMEKRVREIKEKVWRGIIPSWTPLSKG